MINGEELLGINCLLLFFKGIGNSLLICYRIGNRESKLYF